MPIILWVIIIIRETMDAIGLLWVDGQCSVIAVIGHSLDGVGWQNPLVIKIIDLGHRISRKAVCEPHVICE